MIGDEARLTVLRALAEVAPEADLDVIPGDELLTELFDIDSYDFLRFVQVLRDASGADLPEGDYLHLLTLDGAVAYLDQLISAPPSTTSSEPVT